MRLTNVDNLPAGSTLPDNVDRRSAAINNLRNTVITRVLWRLADRGAYNGLEGTGRAASSEYRFGVEETPRRVVGR